MGKYWFVFELTETENGQSYEETRIGIPYPRIIAKYEIVEQHIASVFLSHCTTKKCFHHRLFLKAVINE